MRANSPTIKSHYDYLDAVIEQFGALVLSERERTQFNKGTVVAHGDKCYHYMDRARKDHGIHPFHFAILYLLTYTSLMDKPKHESYNWVVTKHEHYLPIIHRAEEAAGIGDIVVSDPIQI